MVKRIIVRMLDSRFEHRKSCGDQLPVSHFSPCVCIRVLMTIIELQKILITNQQEDCSCRLDWTCVSAYLYL